MPRLFRHRWLWWTAGALAVLVLMVFAAFSVTPWLGTRVIRSMFERDAAAVKKSMEPFAPLGITEIPDQPYRPGDPHAQLDVYFPATADQPGVRLPALVWTHGGAWVSGHRDDAAPYFQLVASHGYTVISLDYSLAPGRKYPTPVHQVNDALAYVQQHADRFHVDVDRLMLAGDSAGAQITSQVAALTTNPVYAAALGVTPSLRPEQLRGVILYCGYYDMPTFVEEAQLTPSRLLRWGTDTIVWAYTGHRTPDDALLQEMSTINHVTPAFPPTFLRATGNRQD